MDMMIDLETMGTGHNAPIISIGAVVFDRKTGLLGEEFYSKIDFLEAMSEGDPDAETIKWWMQQGNAARLELISGSSSLIGALGSFHTFCVKHSDINVWGNGATFDITILESAFHRHGVKVPWKFWAVRDVRTVVDLASEIMPRPPMTKGVAHNALDDAKHQARYVMGMINALQRTAHDLAP